MFLPVDEVMLCTGAKLSSRLGQSWQGTEISMPSDFSCEFGLPTIWDFSSFQVHTLHTIRLDLLSGRRPRTYTYTYSRT